MKRLLLLLSALFVGCMDSEPSPPDAGSPDAHIDANDAKVDAVADGSDSEASDTGSSDTGPAPLPIGSDKFVVLAALTSDGPTVPGDGSFVASGETLYFTDSAANTVNKVPLEGGVAATPLLKDDGDGHAIALSGSQLYWVNYAKGRIRRANIDGSDVKT